jgi:hypothetical protein
MSTAKKTVKSIIDGFADKSYIDQNDFERMAVFSDNFMHEKIKELREASEKFDASGEYSDYLAVARSFEDATKYMNARDSYITHNPDKRNY